uniref:Putative Dormancy/auxin associated family protein n=1 Tax=Davidia involucrata TaxID=16924 RepID=A0A5B6ZGL1_DAVIN
MGFLHKIWDETLAGPTPDTGLGKLRKYDSFSAARSPPDPVITVADEIPVTRTITILRTNSTPSPRIVSVDPGSVPSSPPSSSTPIPTSPFSPITPGPGGDFKRLTRRKSSRPEAFEHAEPRSPTVYDWIVISALDR